MPATFPPHATTLLTATVLFAPLSPAATPVSLQFSGQYFQEDALPQPPGGPLALADFTATLTYDAAAPETFFRIGGASTRFFLDPTATFAFDFNGQASAVHQGPVLLSYRDAPFSDTDALAVTLPINLDGTSPDPNAFLTEGGDTRDARVTFAFQLIDGLVPDASLPSVLAAADFVSDAFGIIGEGRITTPPTEISLGPFEPDASNRFFVQSVTPVPEPASLVLLAAGAYALLPRRR